MSTALAWECHKRAVRYLWATPEQARLVPGCILACLGQDPAPERLAKIGWRGRLGKAEEGRTQERADLGSEVEIGSGISAGAELLFPARSALHGPLGANPTISLVQLKVDLLGLLRHTLG